jgi:DNA helicase-2/ATP-dependent DNA helicase PcrA
MNLQMTEFSLTSEQKKAIDHFEGNLQIIACAGSGKTDVVSRRIAELIRMGERPKSIVAFTFTEKAAEELKTRIRLRIEESAPGTADFGDMYVGTIHGFCFQMLQELDPKYRNYEIMDDARRVAFISMPKHFFASHLPTLIKREGTGKFAVIRKFFHSADIVRMEDIDPAKLSDEDFRICFERYELSLDKEHFLDFSEMIYRLVKLLDTDEAIRKALHDRVRHLVVDEYQDIDRIQERLIRHIAQGCRSLCVVGDDDQCIYNWRGSAVEYIINFSKNYDPVTPVSLSTNFRSTSHIIGVANPFIRNNHRRLKKNMEPRSDPQNALSGEDLFYRQFDTEEQEFEFIVRRITDLHGSDFHDKHHRGFSLSYGDFAILVRRKNTAIKLIPFLEKAGIPFILDIGGEVFQRPEVQLAYNCLGYLFGKEGPEASRDNVISQYTAVFLARLADGKPVYPKADAEKFIRKLEEIKTKVDVIFAKDKKDYLQDGLQPYFHEILNAFGTDEFELEEVYNYNLAVLSQAIADYESVWRRIRASEVKWFFGFISAYGSQSYTETGHQDPSLIDAVKILTIHKAKGLEFPVVFIPGMVEEQSPRTERTFVDPTLYNVQDYTGDDEDERRVLYTAITRSEKYLFISGSRQRKKADGKPYARPASPHPMINEIVTGLPFTDKTEIHPEHSGFPVRRNASDIFPTSYSDINCYKRCGYDYQLRSVYCYQAGVPAGFGYGTRIHNILNIIYNDYIRNGTIPAQADVDKLFDQHFFLRYSTDEMAKNMKESGKKVVKNYLNIHSQDFSKVLETEKAFEFVLGDALISGRIDLLKKMDESGNISEVEIVDFKSEKEDIDLYSRDYALQLRLYAMACFESLGLHPQKATVHHLDAEGGHKIDIPIDEQSLKIAKGEISASISGIIGKQFNPCPTKHCADCDWRKICSKK